MIDNITITYRGAMEAKVKGLPGEIKKALIEAVLSWHGTGKAPKGAASGGFLKFHFTRQAPFRYSGVYKGRSSKYERYKYHRFGHNDPLTFKGELKRNVTVSIATRGTSKNVRGIMQGGNVLNFGGRDGMPDMRAEITAVNPAEEQALRDIVYEQIMAWLQEERPNELRKLKFEVASAAVTSSLGSFSV